MAFRKGRSSWTGAGNLRLDRDPKQVWADSNPGFYPVRINTADKEALLRIPGIGPDTVKKILMGGTEQRLACIEDLGIRGKRATLAKGYVVFE